MFDALGFKGLWKRHDASVVLQKLRSLQEHAEHVPMAFGGPEPAEFNVFQSVRVAVISDTVAIGLGVRQNLPAVLAKLRGDNGAFADEAFVNALALDAICRIVSRFLYQAGETAPTLAYRGAISFGEHIVTDRFVVGPAVDDAAEHMELASAALVWMTPTALDTKRNHTKQIGQAVHPALYPWALDHDVPTAAGTLKTFAVNPFAAVPPTDDGIAWRSRILASFSTPSVRVRVLRDNTAAFLEHAISKREALLHGPTGS